MALTDLKIRRTQPQLKDLWLTDEKGLRLLIKPSGARYWRLRYRFGGKQKTLALGVYPEITLKMAREERQNARRLLSKGIDPSLVKKELKQKSIMDDTNTFSVLTKEWWNFKKGVWTEDHAKRLMNRLKVNVFKTLDTKPINQIKPQDILYIIKEIESRNALDIASRVLQDIRRIFSYGVRMGWLKYNPAAELIGVTKPRKKKHLPSMKNHELGQFLCELDGYQERGRELTKLALQLLIFTFARSGEIRLAQWKEFDFAKSLWIIPAERMKMRTEHHIPLSTQALDTLVKIQEITGTYDLLFPSERNWRKAMSDNTMRRAMRHLGYDGQHPPKSKATPHGFRANASSILNEKEFNPDAIERQLSHMERNNVRAAYLHHAQYMQLRIEMMQWWADYLDKEKLKFKVGHD